MPYFVYKLYPTKKLESIASYPKFPEAKQHARELRNTLTGNEDYVVKMIFAKNEAEAEKLLTTEREYRPEGEW
jgi:hypothetical protein